MYDNSEAQTLIQSDDTKYSLRLKFAPNAWDFPFCTTIKATFTHELMSELSFGNVVCQKMEAEVRDVILSEGEQVQDATIYAIAAVNPSSDNIEVPLGVFNIIEPIEKDEYGISYHDTITKITAYDNVIKLQKAYTSELSYPATIQSIIDEVETLCGVNITDITYPAITIPSQIEADTCTEVMEEICKLLGKNMVADRNGALKFTWFTQTDITITASDYTKLSLSDNAYELGTLACSLENTVLTSGTSGDTLSFACPYMTQSQLDSILSDSTLTYYAAESDFFGNMLLDAGDIITVNDTLGNSYTVPIMSNTLEFDGGFKNSIESFMETTSSTELYKGTGIKRKVMGIQKDIDGFKVLVAREYVNNQNMQSIIEASADQITTSVERNIADTFVARDEVNALYVNSSDIEYEDNKVVSLTLTAQLFELDEDITNTIASSQFTWTRHSSVSETDTIFNNKGYTGTSITLSEEDIEDCSSFVCTYTKIAESTIDDTGGNTILDTGGNNIIGLNLVKELKTEYVVAETFSRMKASIDMLANQIVLQVDVDGHISAVELSSGNRSAVKIKGDDITLEGATTINNGVVINEDGTLTVGPGATLAGWDIQQGLINKKVTIGSKIYHVAMQIADGQDTKNNFYVRHSSNNGASWTYDYAVDYTGKVTATKGKFGGLDLDEYGFHSQQIRITSSELSIGNTDDDSDNWTQMRKGAFYIHSGMYGTVLSITPTRIKSYTPSTSEKDFELSQSGLQLYYLDPWIKNMNGQGIQLDTTTNAVKPTSDNAQYLGYSGKRWQALYAASSTIVTSDGRQKTDIEELQEKYFDFFEKLTAVRYKFVAGESGRTHVGFVAQDVEQAMTDCGLTSLDFAGLIKSPITDDDGEVIDYEYALRYEEFIALQTAVLQREISKRKEIEDRLTKIEEAISCE